MAEVWGRPSLLYNRGSLSYSIGEVSQWEDTQTELGSFIMSVQPPIEKVGQKRVIDLCSPPSASGKVVSNLFIGNKGCHRQ